jgi:hypothetical protein
MDSRRRWSQFLIHDIDADEDCSVEAQALIRAEADLRLYLQRREDGS